MQKSTTETFCVSVFNTELYKIREQLSNVTFFKNLWWLTR